jgi:glycosyltransferase involved in cell wall biosynthesis
MPMRLCVVIPALNEAAHLPALLADLAPLRARGHWLILVDGGSQDGAAALAAGRVDRIVETAAGRARQMNAGVLDNPSPALPLPGGNPSPALPLSGKGADILWFLHADSRVPAGAGEAILDRVAAGAVWGFFPVRLSGRSPWFRLIERLMNLRSRLTGIASGDQGLFVRRADFVALGGYADLPLMEDIELSRRLRARARPAVMEVALTTSSRRWEARGVLRTMLLMWSLRLLYWAGVRPERLARWYR